MICPFCNKKCKISEPKGKTIYSCNVNTTHSFVYDKRLLFYSDYVYHETLKVQDEFIIFNDSDCYLTASTIDDKIFFEKQHPLSKIKRIPTHFKTLEELQNYLILI